MANVVPLQLYSSAIIFAPTTSVIKKLFQAQILKWFSKLPHVPSTWSPELQTLEGHRFTIDSLAFSPDGQVLASGSRDCAVKLWNSFTGDLVQTLEGPKDWITVVAWSHDGILLASGSRHGITFWNACTAEPVRTIDVYHEINRSTVANEYARLNQRM